MATAPKKKVTKKTPLPTLTKGELKRIKALGTHWELDDKQRKLIGTFAFGRYLDGFMFATRISVHAEVLNHHPELCITPGEVRVTLTTHDTKAVTEKDIELAERINQIISTRR